MNPYATPGGAAVMEYIARENAARRDAEQTRRDNLHRAAVARRRAAKRGGKR